MAVVIGDLDSHLVDVQAFADRIGIAEQVSFDRASDHAHSSHRRDILVGDLLALGRVPVPRLMPLGFDAPHDGLDLVRAVTQPGAHLPCLGRYDLQSGDLLAEGADVVQGQGGDAQIGRPRGAAAAGDQHHRSGSEVLHALHHLRLGALADGHDYRQCGDADDRPRHHEKCPQRIGCQRLNSFPGSTQHFHPLFSSAGARAASSASASRGWLIMRSSAIWPSSSTMTRWACSANSRSWVTMMMVRPS